MRCGQHSNCYKFTHLFAMLTSSGWASPKTAGLFSWAAWRLSKSGLTRGRVWPASQHKSTLLYVMLPASCGGRFLARYRSLRSSRLTLLLCWRQMSEKGWSSGLCHFVNKFNIGNNRCAMMWCNKLDVPSVSNSMVYWILCSDMP